MANDSDGDDLIFEFVDGDQNGDHSYFTLLADGTLRSAIILNYRVDAKSYGLNIKVSDSKNASLQKLFTVTVANKIEDFDGDGVEDFFVTRMTTEMGFQIWKKQPMGRIH